MTKYVGRSKLDTATLNRLPCITSDQLKQLIEAALIAPVPASFDEIDPVGFTFPPTNCVIERHPGFVFVVTGSTYGEGEVNHHTGGTHEPS